MRKTGVLSERFPALLKSKREARQMSTEELAARIGVSGQKIEMWESGCARPARDKWVSLSNTLGITVEEDRTASPPASLCRRLTSPRRSAASSPRSWCATPQTGRRCYAAPNSGPAGERSPTRGTSACAAGYLFGFTPSDCRL